MRREIQGKSGICSREAMMPWAGSDARAQEDIQDSVVATCKDELWGCRVRKDEKLMAWK